MKALAFLFVLVASLSATGSAKAANCPYSLVAYCGSWAMHTIVNCVHIWQKGAYYTEVPPNCSGDPLNPDLPDGTPLGPNPPPEGCRNDGGSLNCTPVPTDGPDGDRDGDGTPNNQDDGNDGEAFEPGECPDGSAPSESTGQCEDGQCPAQYVRMEAGQCEEACPSRDISAPGLSFSDGQTIPQWICRTDHSWPSAVPSLCMAKPDTRPYDEYYELVPALGREAWVVGYRFRFNGKKCSGSEEGPAWRTVYDPNDSDSCLTGEIYDWNTRDCKCKTAEDYFPNATTGTCEKVVCGPGYRLSSTNGECWPVPPVDSDGDGIPDDRDTEPGDLVDTDGDGEPDLIDTDGDGEGDSTGSDTDGDGRVDLIGTDTDGDGDPDDWRRVHDDRVSARLDCDDVSSCIGAGEEIAGDLMARGDDAFSISGDPTTLYTPQFESMQEVWVKHKASLERTPAMGWIAWFRDHVTITNACPALPDLNLGRLGVYPMQIPCMVWTALALAMNLVTAWTAALLLIDK